MQFIISWLIYTIAILITAYILPGVHISNFWTALIAAVVLGILNVFIKPFLIILTLPINILTLGLFTLVINAFLILLAAQIVAGFQVDGFWWAFLFAIILTIVNSFLANMVET